MQKYCFWKIVQKIFELLSFHVSETYMKNYSKWVQGANCFQKLPDVDSYRLFMGITVTVGTTVTILLNVILLLTFWIIGRTRTTVIYQLIQLLSVVQITYLICNYLVMIPCTFTDCYFYNDTIITSLAWLNTFGYYTSLSINCFTAIERISLFWYPPLNHLIKCYTASYLFLPCCLGFLTTAGTTAIGCFKRYSCHYISTWPKNYLCT